MPRENDLEAVYRDGFYVADLMPSNSVGIVTARDALTIDMDKSLLWERVQDFSLLDAEAAREKYQLGPDAQDWKAKDAIADVAAKLSEKKLTQVTYRPFDHRWTYYTGTARGFHCRPRNEVMQHLVSAKNVALIVPKQTKEQVGGLATKFLSGHKSFSAYDISSVFPLYLYPEEGTLETERRVNFDPKIYAEIRERAGLSLPLPSGEGGAAPAAGGEGDQPAEAPAPSHASRGPLPLPRGEEIPDELLVFDYIYGVLHSPDYRRTYAQFLKIDSPRIPYPASPKVFAHVAEKGGQLRRLHLMEDAAIGATPYPFKGDGDNVVVKPVFAQDPFVSSEDETPISSARPHGLSSSLEANGLGVGRSESGRVHINPDQYFDNVPLVAWEFHIGGYQPAQKWLKDRKGRALSFEDVMHYQKIIKILTETDRIMREIELPL